MNRRCRGMTLVEMLVAVAITVVLLAIIGAVFSHASGATGLAVASNEIMAGARTLTRQLAKDFGGLRPDMPMAIVFEQQWVDLDDDGFDDGLEERIRRDRIVFFANGDFQSLDNVAGNVAKIFYGQSEDTLRLPPDAQGPPRQALLRRWKMQRPDTPYYADGLWCSNASNMTIPWFDFYNYETATLGFWKNEPAEDFEDYYFTTQAVASLVRRPNLAFQKAYGGSEAVQRLYFLPDVGDLRIQVWFEDSTEWFPAEASFDENVTPWTLNAEVFAFYWNTPLLSTTPWLFDDINWWPGSAWPKALRFTFTLYDKNRSSFPKGRTFSYIVELPPRER